MHDNKLGPLTDETAIKLVIISGRSGSGKTTALQALEDAGYYCVDNLPAKLIPELIHSLREETQKIIKHIAVGVDARNLPGQLQSINEIVDQLKTLQIQTKILFLDSNDTTLIQRFSSTRRKHPLSNNEYSLAEAIEKERQLLQGIARRADLIIDTSQLNIHQLRELIKNNLDKESKKLSLLFVSFGFKKGVPIDADFVYDVRCLPNPYWHDVLREKTGQDRDIIDFLEKDELTGRMINDIDRFLKDWLHHFENSNRAYLTVAIGCTGGQHRSVYVAEQLKKRFDARHVNTQMRHRELTH